MKSDQVHVPLWGRRSFALEAEFDLGPGHLVNHAHCLVLSGIESVWATCKTRALLYRLSRSDHNEQRQYEFQQIITSHVPMPEDGAIGRIGSGFINGIVAVYQLTRTDPGPVQLRWLNANGKISCSPVTSLTWSPSRPYYLYVAHAQGAVIVYDLRLDHEYPMRLLNTDISLGLRPSIRQRFMSRREMRKSSSVSEVETSELRVLQRRPDAGHNPIQCLVLSADPLTAMKFAPDGHLLGIGKESGLLIVLDLQDKSRTPVTVAIFHSGFGAISSLAWYQTGDEGRSLIAAGSQDDSIALYDVYSGICLAQRQEHISWPTSLAFISQPDADLLISVGEDCLAIVWRLPQTIRKFNNNEDDQSPVMNPHTPAIEMIAKISIDNEPIAALAIGDLDHGPVMSTISRYGRVKIWHLTSS